MKTALTIKEIPLSERPYEKLESLGASFLSDAELLAIIIKSGSAKEKSTDLALRLLNKHPSGLLGLYHLSLQELQEIHGIGRVKAIQLKALAEVSKRISSLKYHEKIKIQSPSELASVYMESMRHLDREHLKVVLLDTKHKIISDKDISIGTVNASLVHPREILIYALKNKAVAMILIHNHPSGNPEPSPEDIAVTKRVYEASEVVGIHLLDHLIIGDGTFVSLKEKGYIT